MSSLIVTPGQALARLQLLPVGCVVDMMLVLPMADLADEVLPPRAGFDSTQAWLDATCAAYDAEVARIDTYWRQLALAAGVQPLSEPDSMYLSVRGATTALATLLNAPDLFGAYFLTDREGPCGVSKMPWVYRRSQHEPRSASSLGDTVVDAPLGLVCAEDDLDRMAEYHADARAGMLKGVASDLQWAVNELQSDPDHPRVPEYVRRVAVARARLESAYSLYQIARATELKEPHVPN